MGRPRSRSPFAEPAVAVLGALALGACGGDPPPRTNLLLISLDSTRRDVLGAYGYHAPHAATARSSPNLDRLADEGVLMEDAYATTSWTFPSHVSLFSGQPELVHAVDLDFHRLDPARPTLAQILAARGYRTAGFFSGPYLEPRYGFDRGFEHYEACYGPRLAAAFTEARAAAERLALAEEEGSPERVREARRTSTRAQRLVEQESHRDVSARAVSEAVVAELRASATSARESGRPFFVFAHFFDPHYDYVPPDPFGHDLDPEYTGALDGRDFYTNPAISTHSPERPDVRTRVVEQRDLEHVKSLYAAELAWTDAQIGAILGELERLGLAQRTLVVVLADHGDEFFEHGSIGHRWTLYEEVVRIPMILRLPGALPRAARVHGPVSTIDVLPTVLELLGVPAPGGLASAGFLGLVRGEESGDERVVLGRLVTSLRTSLDVPEQDDPDGVIPGIRYTLLETYLKGSLKLTRERSWLRHMAPVSPGTALRLGEESLRLRALESLRWIDLERFPDERDEDHSSDFSDARARAALLDFQERYVELSRRRRSAVVSPEDEGGAAELRGLGYAGAEDEHAAVESDEFTLPPPGAALLGEEAR